MDAAGPYPSQQDETDNSSSIEAKTYSSACLSNVVQQSINEHAGQAGSTRPVVKGGTEHHEVLPSPRLHASEGNLRKEQATRGMIIVCALLIVLETWTDPDPGDERPLPLYTTQKRTT